MENTKKALVRLMLGNILGLITISIAPNKDVKGIIKLLLINRVYEPNDSLPTHNTINY